MPEDEATDAAGTKPEGPSVGSSELLFATDMGASSPSERGTSEDFLIERQFGLHFKFRPFLIAAAKAVIPTYIQEEELYGVDR